MKIVQIVNSTTRIRRARAVTLIEFLIILPLFLFGIFFFIWLGTTFNAKTSLASAVGNAVRLAASRGRPNVQQLSKADGDFGGRLAFIDSLHSKSVVNPDGTISKEPRTVDAAAQPKLNSALVSKNMPGAQAESLIQLMYNKPLADVYKNIAGAFDCGVAGLGLDCIPYPEHAYAIVYAIQAMRLSIGNSIRYPCDPSETSEENQYGQDCLWCRPVNPHDLSDEEYEQGDFGILGKRIALRCDYRPYSAIVTPLVKLLGIMSGGTIGNADGLSIISYAQISDSYSGCKSIINELGVSQNCCVNDNCFNNEEED